MNSAEYSADKQGGEINDPLRILHLEEKTADVELAKAVLEADGISAVFTHVAREAEFVAALEGERFDLILADYVLPGLDGLAALALALQKAPDTPVIFVSGVFDEDSAIESLQKGAADYVLKDRLRRLPRAVRRAVRVAAAQAERKELERQPRHAQRMEAVGQIVGGIAHDFNNLLAVILGHTEMLLMNPRGFSDEVCDSLKEVVAATERASNLTRQLLVFSRKQAMKSRPVNLNEVVGGFLKRLKRIIGEHIELEWTPAEGLPLVEADAGMMEQVLANLVVNAREAMPQGGRLRVTTTRAQIDEAFTRDHPEARVGSFVCLEVTDTGSGIAPEHLSRIFEPFFTTKPEGPGTGLGLATAYSIVKQHHGWFDVLSRPGAGATFRIFLPVTVSLPATATVGSRSTRCSE
jgi:signal transduction histidine kinase